MERKLCETIMEEPCSVEALLKILAKVVNINQVIYKIIDDTKPQFGVVTKEIESYILQAVQLLIDAGTDVNLKDENGDTPLHLAASIVNVQLIKFLLTQGADVNAKNSKTGRTPLHTLMSSMYLEDKLLLAQADALEVLLSSNADVNAVELLHGDTPLHYFFKVYIVSANNYCESFFKIVKIFMKHRADFKIKNLKDETPVDIFLQNFQYFKDSKYPEALIDTFIKYGLMDVDTLITPFDETVLQRAVYMTLNYNLIKVLVNYGANINIQIRYGTPPLIGLIKGLLYRDHLGDDSINYKLLNYFLNLNPDVNVIFEASHILSLDYDVEEDDDFKVLYPEIFWKTLIEFIAKKLSTGCLLHEYIKEDISEKVEYQSYLDKCTEELKSLQKLKFHWMDLYDILMDPKKKLDSYAKDKELVREFNELLLAQKYPIYGPHIVKRFTKAVQNLEIKEKSAAILSSCLPCHMDPSNLVIEKIISFLKKKYLRYLCEPESNEIKKKIQVEEFKISFEKYFCNCYNIV